MHSIALSVTACWRSRTFQRLATAVLTLVLLTAGGRAWAQAPPAAADSLERAAALVQAGAFDQAAALLRRLVSADPSKRRAKEMLAFALESSGDLNGERRVRSDLALESPDDPRIQADYGRVLERSGDDSGALRAYRRARGLSAYPSALELDAAIERMRGRTAVEVGTPAALMSDPDATASRIQLGASVPLGSRYYMVLLGSHYAANGRTIPERTTADAIAFCFSSPRGAGATWTAGPSMHATSPASGAKIDAAAGGAIAGRVPIGPRVEVDGKAEVEVPWDETAITVLRGGRTTVAEGHVYLHGFSRRLLLQAGARRRGLSIAARDPRSARPESWQSLWLAGADVVLWARPRAAVRGEMLDETLTAPTTMSSAVTVAYRHYDLSSQTTPEFTALIGLVPRGLVDEGSIVSTVASPGGHVGLELRGGVARDSERNSRLSRGGGSLVWAPASTTRLAFGYDEATEFASGFIGRSRAGRLSVHVDF
jgi:hypothetical protein